MINSAAEQLSYFCCGDFPDMQDAGQAGTTHEQPDSSLSRGGFRDNYRLSDQSTSDTGPHYSQ